MNKEKKLFKDKKKMEKLNNSKNAAVEIKLPDEGGLFFDKIINLFVESLGIFSLADNNYYKQIDYLTKSDLINYYKFCERIDDDKSEFLNKKEMNSLNDIFNNTKIEIENKLFILLLIISFNEFISFLLKNSFLLSSILSQNL